jgi:hypothetical protein
VHEVGEDIRGRLLREGVQEKERNTLTTAAFETPEAPAIPTAAVKGMIEISFSMATFQKM